MRQNRADFRGISYFHHGGRLDENRRSIIFFFGSAIERYQEGNVIKSAVEAVAHGYDIITNGRYRARRALNLPVLAYSGRMNVMLTPSLCEYELDGNERVVLLTGGSFFSFHEKKEEAATLLEDNIKLLNLADRVLFIGRALPYLVTEALDRGMEIAVMKDFLWDRNTREIALSGCPVIDTFSSWLSYPQHIAYEINREGRRILSVMDYR